MGVYLVRLVELGREQQARLGKQRKDLAAVIAARWPAARVTTAPGRVIVDGDDGIEAELAALPGLGSVSPCTRVARADVVAAAVARARDALALPGTTFAVRVRRDRRDGGEPSLVLARAIADAVVAATGAGVDLSTPDVTLGVELRGDVAYVFDRVVAGVDRAGPPRPRAAGVPRFVADQMLGRLAARLRLLGYDTLTVFDIADSEVTRLAAADGRVLLTRDGPLARTLAVPVHFVAATRPQAQLAEVVAALGLAPDPAHLFTRCTLCNAAIEAVDAHAVAARVPPHVIAQAVPCFRCPGCDQVYWRGSHVERILDDLTASLGPQLEA